MVSQAEAQIVQEQLEELHQRHLGIGEEDVVSYYPPGAESEPHRFGIAGCNIDGTMWAVGDADYRFPLHSMSKVFTYGLALEDNGQEATRRRVGIEPSGDPFNSITFDEVHNRPFNPMINAGALVAASLVAGRDREEKVTRLLDRLRRYTGNDDLRIDEAVLAEQLTSNDRNLGLSYIMRSLGMIDGDIEENIAVYLSACSVTVTARELSVMGGTLANRGVNPHTGERALASEHVRDVISVMWTCGMYDAAGQWATDVGIPAKSGVSGGIVTAIPDYFGLGVVSPGLDEHGNSVRGINLCRELSERFGLHLFTDPSQSRFGRIAAPDMPRTTAT